MVPVVCDTVTVWTGGMGGGRWGFRRAIHADHSYPHLKIVFIAET